MSLDVDEQRATASDHRPARWWWIIAGVAAVLVVAVVLAVLLWVRGDGGSPTHRAAAGGDHPRAAPTAPVMSALQVPAAGGRCMVPSRQLLASHPIAFAGRVSTVGAAGATVTVTQRFAGRVADSVVVRQPPRTTEPGLNFRAGHTYLLSATGDGTVAVCGLSGEKTPALATMYAAAFGG